MQERKVFWPLLIAGWSGFYVMLVELLGGRFIAPYFGSSVYVWGSVIFVFMIGLAIGYLLGGIYSRHNPSVRPPVRDSYGIGDDHVPHASVRGSASDIVFR